MNNNLSQQRKAIATDVRKALKKISISTVAEQRQAGHSQGSRAITRALMLHLEAFAGHEVTVDEVTLRFCTSFAKYLVRNVNVESARTYLQKLHAILAACVRKRYLAAVPMPDLRELLPHKEWSERTFLTVEELARLMEAPCPSHQTRQAFLFSCYTGLRLSDIETLAWDDIYRSPAGPVIVKRQKKTRHEVRVPLCRQAQATLEGIPRGRGKRVFPMRSRSSIANDLRTWALEAGIAKRITFHVARHTFASMLFSYGVDMPVISRLCGHSSLRTTEIYTHIADNRLKEGIMTIENLLIGAGVDPQKTNLVPGTGRTPNRLR